MPLTNRVKTSEMHKNSSLSWCYNWRRLIGVFRGVCECNLLVEKHDSLGARKWTLVGRIQRWLLRWPPPNVHVLYVLPFSVGSLNENYGMSPPWLIYRIWKRIFLDIIKIPPQLTELIKWEILHSDSRNLSSSPVFPELVSYLPFSSSFSCNWSSPLYISL